MSGEKQAGTLTPIASLAARFSKGPHLRLTSPRKQGAWRCPVGLVRPPQAASASRILRTPIVAMMGQHMQAHFGAHGLLAETALGLGVGGIGSGRESGDADVSTGDEVGATIIAGIGNGFDRLEAKRLLGPCSHLSSCPRSTTLARCCLSRKPLVSG